MIRTFISDALGVSAAVSSNLLRRSAKNRWGLKGASVQADCGEVVGFSGSRSLDKAGRLPPIGSPGLVDGSSAL